jgi:hypothetical protein
LGDRRSLPSSTGGRNIHYIEFQFEIPEKQRSTEYVQRKPTVQHSPTAGQAGINDEVIT